MSSLVNVATTENYAPAATLSCPRTERLFITVANAAVIYQLGAGWPDIVWEGDETFLVPVVASLGRRCDAVRFRSATAGVPARVSVEAVPEGVAT
jgi:hypothetical protein